MALKFNHFNMHLLFFSFSNPTVSSFKLMLKNLGWVIILGGESESQGWWLEHMALQVISHGVRDSQTKLYTLPYMNTMHNDGAMTINGPPMINLLLITHYLFVMNQPKK